MPITITVPGRDLFDEKTQRFITTKKQTITLEHSLLSISKWESKWHKPFLTRDEKTEEENVDYYRCMCITPNVDPNVFRCFTMQNVSDIAAYISDSMTATTFSKKDRKPSREIVTNELVYYWMTQLNIPFDPCQKWHFNRLMTLIEVVSIKSQPSKKMKPGEVLRQNHSLNAARRAKLHSKG